jgi:tetratricopeptide (TPR) repeat protein/TolB-like protein
MSLYSGQIFGHYEIIEILGSGGMGQVYRARDSRLNREVAIKILSADLTGNPELLARFKKEAAFAAVLNHPNICTIYETGEVNGQTYISMEYVQGQTLRSRIAGKNIPLPEFLDIAIQIADGLEEARKKNIVHRDIKSINILVTERGLVKILDFGLAKQLRVGKLSGASEQITQSSLTQTGDVRGTPAYMSPEQALGKTVDHRSDIFSFGIVLYEMLTEHLPFSGSSTTEVVDAILHADPPPITRYRDRLPPELAQIISKMLEKDPNLRYQSVYEAWVDLRRLRGDSTMKSSIAARASVKSRRLYFSLLVVGILIAALIGAFVFVQKKREPAASVSATHQKNVAIAVLPFRYIGEDPTRQYLGTLVTDGLIAGLQAIRGVAIAPYASVRELKDTTPVAEVVHDLGVQWIIRGTIGTEGEAAQLNAEAVSADGTVAWKRSFTGRTIVALDQTTKNIVNELRLPDSDKQIGQLRTVNVDSYKQYLEARGMQEGWDVGGNLEDSIRLYREAIGKDPDFSAAHAGLAMALLKLFDQKHDPGLLSSANDEAKRAIALDPNLPEALLAHGMVQATSGNSIEARDAFMRALELAPGNDEACRSLADMYSGLGRNADAEEMFKHAIELRPSYWKNHFALGKFQWQYTGQLDSARFHLEKAIELHPEGFAPLVVMGSLYLTQGNLEEAESYFRKALERSANPFAYNNLGLVYYYRGQFDLALRNWEAILKDAPDKPLYQANVADALRQLHRTDEANDRYKQAIEKFRETLRQNPSDDKARASMAMALAAIGECNEAAAETRGVLTRHVGSTELAGYAAISVSRCGDLKWAKQIVLDSIATDNLLQIRYDPDLAKVRELPEVKTALDRAIAQASKSSAEHQ